MPLTKMLGLTIVLGFAFGWGVHSLNSQPLKSERFAPPVGLPMGKIGKPFLMTIDANPVDANNLEGDWLVRALITKQNLALSDLVYAQWALPEGVAVISGEPSQTLVFDSRGEARLDLRINSAFFMQGPRKNLRLRIETVHQGQVHQQYALLNSHPTQPDLSQGIDRQPAMASENENFTQQQKSQFQNFRKLAHPTLPRGVKL